MVTFLLSVITLLLVGIARLLYKIAENQATAAKLDRDQRRELLLAIRKTALARKLSDEE